jgi:phosphatidylglycerophosphate synthase
MTPLRENVFESIFNIAARRVSHVFIVNSVSPNLITLVSALLGIIGCWFLLSETLTTVLIGALLVYLYAVLDLVDGDVARALSRTSTLGGFIDTSFDKLIEFLLFLVLILIGLREDYNATYVLLIIISYFLFSFSQFIMVYSRLASQRASTLPTKIKNKPTQPPLKKSKLKDILVVLTTQLTFGHSSAVFVIPIMALVIPNLFLGGALVTLTLFTTLIVMISGLRLHIKIDDT